MTQQHRTTPVRPASSGFTLVETVVSMLIVGIMLAAAMATVSASARSQKSFSDRATASALAEDLMAEIVATSYEDPTAGAVIVFGKESGETTRADFDDVDDYNGWSESAVQNKDGTAVAGFTAWSRSVSVTLMTTTDPAVAASGSDLGVKRITVQVSKNGTKLATLTAVRTKTL
jgi:MSHA pilin protein MshD